MGEGADFLITQKPRDLRNRQVWIAYIALGEVRPEVVENASESQPFRRQPPCEGSLANAEPAGNVFRPRLAVGQERDNRILQAQS